MLPVNDEESVSKRLQEAFLLIQAEIPITEVVLLNFANEIQHLKEQALDLEIQIRGIMEASTDLPTKLLLYILVNEGSTAEKMEGDFAFIGYTKAQIRTALNRLLKKQQVTFSQKERKYTLNMLIKPTA